MGAILRSALIVLAIAVAVGGATTAYFSDSETSDENVFTAGTLDLVVDGENPLASAKFNVTNMRPGNQPKGTYRLVNDGSIDGYLDIESVVVASDENACNEPETEAGDTTCGDPGKGDGEIADVVNVRLFEDEGCDGWISTGDNVFYNGFVKDMPGNFELDKSIVAGGEVCVVALFDWWSTADDNLAQGDSMQIDLVFELGQTTAQ